MTDSRRLQAKLLDHIPAAVVVSDARHRIVYCNHEARELYGCAEGGEVPFELAETAQHAERWEGKLTIGGPLQPFKSGAGLIAVEGASPVVPMKLKINRVSILDHMDKKWSNDRANGWRGDVEVVFGDPIYFPVGTSASDATAKLHAAVAAL